MHVVRDDPDKVPWFWVITVQMETPRRGGSDLKTMRGVARMDPGTEASERYRQVTEHAFEKTGIPFVVIFYHCEKETE